MISIHVLMGNLSNSGSRRLRANLSDQMADRIEIHLLQHLSKSRSGNFLNRMNRM